MAESDTGEGLGVLARTTRDRRRALGLRQNELADLAGCSTRFVHMLEHGKPTLRLDKVLDVLGVLGCELQVTGRPQGSAEAHPEAPDDDHHPAEA